MNIEHHDLIIITNSDSLKARGHHLLFLRQQPRTEAPTVKKLQQDVEWTVTCDRPEHNHEPSDTPATHESLQSMSGTGTHPGTSTVAQATSQFEDDTPLAPAQPDGTQKRKRGRPKDSKDKQARKKRQKHTEANTPQAGFSAGAV
ncbi:hypothetical protein V8E54_011709 [Elaphomyces granulatus]